jgi:hypothetical protein
MLLQEMFILSVPTVLWLQHECMNWELMALKRTTVIYFWHFVNMNGSTGM